MATTPTNDEIMQFATQPAPKHYTQPATMQLLFEGENPSIIMCILGCGKLLSGTQQVH